MSEIVELTLRVPSGTVPLRYSSGGTAWAAQEIASQLGSKRPRLFLITDERVALLYGARFCEELRDHGLEVEYESFPPGEEQKHLRCVSSLIDRLAAEKFARDDLIIGLGGGVVTDIAGFVAAIYKRGINWVAVPTTLLGMVDAAIGGKTGVDHPLGKNLLGVFHQPTVVLAPVATLNTLDSREWVSGSAEMLKAALLAGGPMWRRFRERSPVLRDWPSGEVVSEVPQAAAVKTDIVAQDEREAGLRRLLNLGHTFAHAIETATGYSVFRHGEALFLGLRAAVRLSQLESLMSKATADDLESYLARAPFPRAQIEPSALLDSVEQDKKRIAGRTIWVLLRAPGDPVLTSDVSGERVRNVGQWLCDLLRTGQAASSASRRLRILVVNGPNLNLLGTREVEVYGPARYSELMERLEQYARERDVELLVRHSNVEGDLVTIIQQARHWADGLVVNPGGYTHTSVSVRDALAAVALPAIEVHLTEIGKREEFRRVSLIEPVCAGQMTGRGIEGYCRAIDLLTEIVQARAGA